jgi:hypothetical protein
MNWDILTVAGFVAWLVAVPGFVFSGLGSRRRLRQRPALVWGLAFLTGYAVWVLGMMRLQ